MDGYKNKVYDVQKEDGSARRFIRSKMGLSYMDVTNPAVHLIPAPKVVQQESPGVAPAQTEPVVEHGVTALISTVEDKKSKYTVRAYKKAELARKLQNLIGPPSLQDFLSIVDGNQLRNCPITREDIMAAEDILGTNLGSLKGKTVRSNGEHVSFSKQIIPPDILLKYKDVTLAMDIMFVNKLPFLLTLSRDIKFGTVEYLLSRGHTNVMNAIRQIKALYRIRGFRVRHIHSDGEFSAMEADLLMERITLTTCANDESPTCFRQDGQQTRVRGLMGGVKSH